MIEQDRASVRQFLSALAIVGLSHDVGEVDRLLVSREFMSKLLAYRDEVGPEVFGEVGFKGPFRHYGILIEGVGYADAVAGRVA